ncbi:MAG: GNAT family N-acetyltransferase [Acetobacteraceae bacterium]|nr:GNAT family N-acetyltransferase [Acetobacteraceae bacterium]
MASPLIREGRDSDAAGFIALISGCWAEYPGCVFDLDGELPELRHLASWFAGQGGTLWAAEQDGAVIGMVATRPMRQDEAWEICRLYVSAAARGTGLAHRLLDTAEAHARANGAQRMVLWTDTRFEAAHAFYEKRGYVRQGAIRILDDLSKSLEFRYAKPARGVVVEALDAAAAASAERRLVAILTACVAAGASVSFLPPLDPATARAYWKGVSQQVAAGRIVLLVGWVEGELAGTVQLDLETQPNQPRRVEVQKLLVDPRFRRRGLATELMRRAEQAAARLGRRLLTLDTREGTAAASLYRTDGWHEAGRIPELELDEAGVERDVVFFWKRVA